METITMEPGQAFTREMAAAAVAIEDARASVVQVVSGGRGLGTGVIWRSNDSRSDIVTNAHVVAAAGHIRIVTHDGREFDATVTANQPQLDLAMVRIEAGNLPVAKVADSTQVRVGEMVFAIGHPWGNTGVVTGGIISGLGGMAVRDPGGLGERRVSYIRSDVRLAPGNSGGPLLNAEGAVIGINAMIFGGDLSVAIGSQVAADWIAPPGRGVPGAPDNPVRLGIGVQAVKLKDKREALLVVAVEPDGAAAQTLLVGDVLIGVGGEAVTDPDHLIGAFTRTARQRGRVQLNVLRGGTPCDVDVDVTVTM